MTTIEWIESNSTCAFYMNSYSFMMIHMIEARNIFGDAGRVKNL